MSKEGAWRWIERAKTLLEILAIIIAAVWAITLYLKYQAPSNVTRVDLQGNLNWYGHSKDFCQAEYEIEFKNIGVIPVEVGKVRLSAWSLSKLDDVTQAEGVKLIDPLKAITGPPLMQQETKRLSGQYAPDERDKEGISFIVRRSPGSLMLFKVDIWNAEKSQGNNEPTWSDYRWDSVCNEQPEASESSK